MRQKHQRKEMNRAVRLVKKHLEAEVVAKRRWEAPRPPVGPVEPVL